MKVEERIKKRTVIVMWANMYLRKETQRQMEHIRVLYYFCLNGLKYGPNEVGVVCPLGVNCVEIVIIFKFYGLEEMFVHIIALLQACIKRIDGDETGNKHCTGQYFDYWHCVDKCVSFTQLLENSMLCYMLSFYWKYHFELQVAPKLFSKLKWQGRLFCQINISICLLLQNSECMFWNGLLCFRNY